MARTTVAEREVPVEPSVVMAAAPEVLEIPPDPDLPPEPQDAAPPDALPGEYGFQLLDPDLAATKTYPYNGNVVMISDDPEQQGRAAMWYTTRRRGGHRWRLWVGWADPVTHKPIEFEPICWRPPSDWNDWSIPIR